MDLVFKNLTSQLLLKMPEDVFDFFEKLVGSKFLSPDIFSKVRFLFVGFSLGLVAQTQNPAFWSIYVWQLHLSIPTRILFIFLITTTFCVSLQVEFFTTQYFQLNFHHMFKATLNLTLKLREGIKSVPIAALRQAKIYPPGKLRKPQSMICSWIAAAPQKEILRRKQSAFIRSQHINLQKCCCQCYTAKIF